jgi:uncharacterized protein
LPELPGGSESYRRPLPQITEENMPFWEGLQRQEFLAPRCNSCGDYNWTPYPACRSCLSTDQRWVPLSGRGTVYSFSVVYRDSAEYDVPHVLAYVELEERPRTMMVLSNVVDCASTDVKIGLPVEVQFHEIQPDLTIYRFAPENH